MITFFELNIRNFLSYGNVPTSVNLNQGGVVLISGTNGVGKSSIIEALIFALYNTTMAEGNVDDLVNDINGRDMEVSVTFHKPTQGYYKVTRARKVGKSANGNFVKLYHNKTELVFEDDHEISLDGTRTTDQLIITVLGMTYEMFSRMIVVSATNSPFLDLPVTATGKSSQTGFMERLFDLHILAEKAQVLKDQIKLNEIAVKQHISKIDQIRQEQSRLNQQIENARNKAENHDSTVKQNIFHYNERLEKISCINIDQERAYYDQVKTAKLEINEFKQQQITLSNSYTKQNAIKDQKESELVSLKNSKCPYCEQHYHNEEKINECTIKIDECNQNILEMVDFLDELDKSIEEKMLEHDDILSKMSVKELEAILNIKHEIDTIKTKISDLKDSKNVYLEQLTELEQIELDPIDTEGLDKLKNLSAHQDFLLKLLTKKDSFVRKTLLNSNLKYLNSRVQKYLQDMGLPFLVEFNSAMAAEIKKLGRKRPFGKLSNGQKSRVNIALTLAFRDVRQKMSAPVNVFMCDECLDVGLDESGISAAISILKKKAYEDKITIYIITHRAETSNLFDQVMHITMDNDFSKIEYKSNLIG